MTQHGLDKSNKEGCPAGRRVNLSSVVKSKGKYRRAKNSRIAGRDESSF